MDTIECGEVRTNLAQDEQQNAVWLAEKKEKELKRLRRDEILKQNEMQLKIKKDMENEEKEKDTAEAKKVFKLNCGLNFNRCHIITFIRLYNLLVLHLYIHSYCSCSKNTTRWRKEKPKKDVV